MVANEVICNNISANGSAECKGGDTLIFFVNGVKVIEKNPDPECTLLTYLREKLRLCGTKLGCGEGGCGACTVMVSRINRTTKEIQNLAVNACLTPVCAMHGASVVTVEGIGSTTTRLHPVQERIAKAHGSQCGFCTPGIVMSMYALLRSSPTPTMKEMEIAFQGNLCRCTGYRPIIEGYRTFTKEYACGMGDKCCKITGKTSNGEILESKLFEPNEFMPYHPTQEPIFPPELAISSDLDRNSVKFIGKRVTWYRPTTLKELLEIKNEHNDAKIVVGNTEVGVEVKFKNCLYPILVQPSQVPELTSTEITENGVRVGASVSLDEMGKLLKECIEKNEEHEVRLYQAIVDMLHYFAGKQIRNVASVGGNIMTGSPISDLNPIFTAAGIELEVASSRGRRKVHMGKGFFTGYRRNIIEPDEILVSIFLPKTRQNQYFIAYKQAKRRDDDIAIVNAAFDIRFKLGTNIVESCSMAFGGMAPTTVLAPKTSEIMKGMPWDEKLVELISHKLLDELPLSASAPGGMITYRRSLTISLFFKAYLAISQQLGPNLVDNVKPSERSGADLFHTKIPKSMQLHEKRTDTKFGGDPVGFSKVHASAYKQATGEAVYCDDMPKFENELYLGLVLSTKAHAKILSIDASKALQMEGVHAFYSREDIGDFENQVGSVIHDEEVFIKDTVFSQGQTIGAIVAENQTLAQEAARMVKIEYQELSPIIVTIEDAIKHKSFFPGYPKTIERGNVDEAFAKADYIVENECRMGGQEHFYLETHAALAVPKDSDELEIFCSSQHPSEVQKLTAHALNMPSSKITVRVKRLGGGFGGKESRGILVSLPAAFAAYKLKRPVRIMLDRNEDMLITGTRHPFYFKYKVACTKDGMITGCELECYNNAGYSMDLSFSVLDRAMFHFENACYIPNCRVKGWVCRTNLPSNTAFRGFGGPQGMFLGEHLAHDVARVTGLDHVDVVAKNLYKEGDRTHYNQVIENSNIRRCWEECLKQSDFHNQRKDIEEFNKSNRWRKRGISIVSTKYGIAFTAPHLNQAGALVNIYYDGTVLLTHGGVEMGQGLHTKMIQVASRTLQIPADLIHISETSTDKVPNTSPTAASVSSDINGMAVMHACQTLNERLKPIKEANPDDDWKMLIHKAYYARVSLSATGFYATPNVGWDPSIYSGKPFDYFTNGVGCSVVEIDCLTGDHQVLRTDIVMDVGSSLNPAIDIGQIEGAFMQGYGLFTLEEMIYSPNGTMFSRGPGVYKLPGFADIPAEFNVSLLTGSPNPRAVYSSKAVGEPPLFLAASVFFAIKHAIESARRERNLDPHFNLISPATSARIRMACEDQFTKMIQEEPVGSYVPWNVMP